MSESVVIDPALQLEVDHARTVNFAMQQNDVPLFRQIRITNPTDSAFSDLRLRLGSAPELFPTWETQISSIAAHGTHVLNTLDLRLSPALLQGLNERMAGVLRAEVLQGDAVRGSYSAPFEMLAFDEWNGLSQSLPELLAAYVLPNHPAVESVLADAAKWLAAKTGDASLSGYQSKSPNRAAHMTQAIYAALLARGITYCNPPASFENTGQKIRLPDRIFDNRLATCLDIALLAAACLEQAGLFPLILLTRGHALTGVWLIEDCFPDCATDTVLPLRKRVELNEMLVFESTLLCAPPPNDFTAAITGSRRHLADSEAFGMAIDIRRCRRSRIRPLPARIVGADGQPDLEATQALRNEQIIQLDDRPVLDQKAAATPKTRLDRWKRKLLDLSLHNRLINSKDTVKTVPLLCPSLVELEDALADEHEFKVQARPTELTDQTPRSGELHRLRTGTDALDALLREEFKSKRLHANLDATELQRRLTEVFRTARTAMEEGGTSALYLALGFLNWYETNTSEQKRRAPLILIPVELRRNSVQEGFRFCQSDEDPRINITLLEMLEKDFALKIPGLDPLPTDEHGMDVAAILNTFRTAIKNTQRWEVVDEAQIGFFSFTKFLMWRDLESRTDVLLKNKVVDHLVNRAGQTFPDDGVGFPDQERLDETYEPAKTYCPLAADSSQLAAVHAAGADKTFVLFGPPGTGKSQTITNIIAHALAHQKSVLFVSEKMAALSVVHHRLSQVGLEPFCLELHSNKVNKRQVIDQLGQALDFRAGQSSEDWEQEAQRLARARSELNVYVQALHLSRSFGETVFQATSKLIGLRDVAPIALSLTGAESITRHRLHDWRDLIERLRTAGDACGHPAGSAWVGCGTQEWSPGLQRNIADTIDSLLVICQKLESQARAIGPQLGLGATWNLSYCEFAEKLTRLLVSGQKPTAALLQDPDWDTLEASLTGWIAHGRSRDTQRQTLLQRYDERLLSLDLDGLKSRLAQARGAWFLKRWLGIRAIRKILAGAQRQPVRLTADAMVVDLDLAIALRQEDKYLAESGDQGRTMLGSVWNDGRADWNAIEQLREWCKQLRRMASTAVGSQLEKAAALCAVWARLLTEGRHLLDPGGELHQSIEQFQATWAEFGRTKAALETTLAAEPTIWGLEPRRLTLADLQAKLTRWKSDLIGLRAWCNWRMTRTEACNAGLQALVDTYESGKLTADALRRCFDRSFYEWWVEAVTEKEPLLSRFFSPEHERKIQQFRDIDERYTQLTRAELQARLASRRPAPSDRASNDSEMGVLQRQRQLRRGHLPVRQLFQKVPHLLNRLKPCVLMSPISVAQYLDAGHPPFDLIVFDEASQIPVWDAVGAIARGAELVVVGDPKQLPPTNFFARSDEGAADDDAAVEEMESILDECLSAQLPQMDLRWHYRSRHESLIAFSNYHYYNNQLLTFPSPYVSQGVSLRHVPGAQYDKGVSGTNRGEAEAVVAEIVKRLMDPAQQKMTIGVVTFSSPQQNLIEDLLDEARRKSPEIEPFFGPDAKEPVFVKNLENVQGDERDVILFSICYGPDAAGRVSMNFGPLNRDGGERRLNVAITRARTEVIVFSTIKAENIDLSRTRARGVQDLKCFLDYADRGPIAISQALTLRGGDDFESPFERDVCEQLRKRGYDVHSQVGCSGYRIDLAIVDPTAPGRYLLGVECDGANYHSAKTARDRDRLREGVLRDLGWRLHRVWSTDWWTNPDDCLAKLDAAIEKAKTAPATVAIPVERPPAMTLIAAAPMAAATPVLEQAAPIRGTYKATNPIEVPRPSDDFYLPAADPVIRYQIEKIVKSEGPVALDLVARRIAAQWQFGRVGATIRDRIEQIARRTDATRVEHDGRVFLWPAGADPAKYNGFRVQGDLTVDQRDIDEIPPEEIVAAAIDVLKSQVCLPRDALVREAGLLLGFQRNGQLVQRFIGVALDLGCVRRQILGEADGRLRLPD